MENKKYYAMLYEANNLDCAVVSYKPLRVVAGYYDEDKDTFKPVDSDEEINSVSMVVPNIGDDDHLIDATDKEMDVENNPCEKQVFFAYPITEEELDTFVEEDELPIKGEIYEREIRGYFMYSLYDPDVDDNIFYIADKLDDHKVLNVNINVDFVEALTTSYPQEDENQKVVLLVAGNMQDAMAQMGVEEVEEAEIQSSPKGSLTPNPNAICDFDPDELEEKISSEVIGQDHVVKALVSMMYKNKKYYQHDGLKSNMLILGPSGCGKTEIVRSLSRHLNIPMTIFDATSASASGYVGNSVTQAIKDLITVCNGDISKAEHGIIVIDEIDKLATSGSGDNVSKGDVQDELFKMLEGDEITIAAESYKEKSFRFNPKNVTFIGIGSAQALIEQKKKDGQKRSIGFGESQKPIPKEEETEVELTPSELIKFGLKPELLRRLNIIKVVKNLKKEDLVTILSESKISNLRIYERAFQDTDHVKLVFDENVLNRIADKATGEKAGAGGLKRVVDDMLESSVRKIRLLKGRPGKLVLREETLDDPDAFDLYATDSNEPTVIYSGKVKVKK